MISSSIGIDKRSLGQEIIELEKYDEVEAIFRSTSSFEYPREESSFEKIADESTCTMKNSIPLSQTAPSFYNWSTTFPQLSILIENIDVLIEESRTITTWTPWPEDHFSDGGHADWKVFPFVHTFPAYDESKQRWIGSTCEHCPRTAALLKQIPNLRTALYSRLGPNTLVSSHRGWADLANHVLRSHCCVNIPGGGLCGLIVDEEECIHKQGDIIIFDDSKYHRAFNKSGEERVVLIVDIVRPSNIPLGSAKGGHTSELDKFNLGSAFGNAFQIMDWNLIDIFCYFSHNLITIPPISWINTCRHHGTQIIGTFITEWEQGEKYCTEMFVSQESALLSANMLLAIAELDCASSSTSADFPDTPYHRYDAVTVDGELKWQDGLTHRNKVFFDICDGIFINYTWKDESLGNSTEIAGLDRMKDLYFGCDVFGRGTPGRGGYQCSTAIELIKTAQLSVALFAPGCILETQVDETGSFDVVQKDIVDKTLLFWEGIAKVWIQSPIPPLNSNNNNNNNINSNSKCNNNTVSGNNTNIDTNHYTATTATATTDFKDIDVDIDVDVDIACVTITDNNDINNDITTNNTTYTTIAAGRFVFVNGDLRWDVNAFMRHQQQLQHQYHIPSILSPIPHITASTSTSFPSSTSYNVDGCFSTAHFNTVMTNQLTLLNDFTNIYNMVGSESLTSTTTSLSVSCAVALWPGSSVAFSIQLPTNNNNNKKKKYNTNTTSSSTDDDDDDDTAATTCTDSNSISYKEFILTSGSSDFGNETIIKGNNNYNSSSLLTHIHTHTHGDTVGVVGVGGMVSSPSQVAIEPYRKTRHQRIVFGCGSCSSNEQRQSSRLSDNSHFDGDHDSDKIKDDIDNMSSNPHWE
eukprot:gene5673-11451_t